MKKWYLPVLIIISILFIFLRLYKLPSSLLFFNDIGRDYWVLYNWQQTHKPPLLGPQTSALPYNQSAVYFYLLMPLFLLTGQSPLASTFTLCLFTITGIGVLFWLTRKKPQFQLPIAVTLFLMTIQPQAIIQSRFVWNPSFVPISILVALVSWLLLLQSWQKRYLFVFALSATLAVSFNYSAAPALIAFILLSGIYIKKKRNYFWFLTATALGALFWNLPTVVFELRHKFLLTNMMLYQEKLTQTSTGWLEKTSDLFHYSLFGFGHLTEVVFILIALAGILLLFKTKTKREATFGTPIVAMFGLTWFITLLVPFSVQAHYIFAFLIAGMFLISILDKRILLGLVLIASVIWLRPSRLQAYFSPAYRSYEDSAACAARVCQAIDAPTFVSVQSDLHPYHNGMEWKYLFARNGCDVKELDTQISEANTMLVVVDHSEYTHGQTAYNELTQFGQSNVSNLVDCSESLKVVIIKKTNQ